MVALSQQDHGVSRVIELAGEVHMIRASGPFELEKQRTRLRNLADEQMETCARQMRYYFKVKTWASGPIACALILMAVDAVLDKYFDPVASLMPTISGFVDETLKRGSELSPFDEDLIRLVQLTDSVNAVSRSVYPFGSNFTTRSFLGEIPSASHTNATIPSPLNNNDVDYILVAMWCWGNLQGRMFDWVSETINRPSTQLSAEQKVRGLEIVCEASSLQVRLLQCFLQLGRISESSYQLLAPYSYWVLIGISQLLGHESWKLLQCGLPVMARDQLHKYALENVGCITTIVNRTGLLNGVIMPLVFSMGLEMVSYKDRRRVLDILDEQQARNFGLSGLFRRALLDAYAGQDLGKQYMVRSIKYLPGT
ncbi:unnamed protein product [Clonostachys solani]|uniref:Uncharacterized protein n=1 Tax=Clonostachys solani TaxID=160281 RepID=A0A9P0EDS1_9HYPO|nr:unnamed protein product [Clonostachys solani]